MASLNLSAYNFKKNLIFNKAKKEAEDFIARWNAAEHPPAESDDTSQLSAKMILPREYLPMAKEIHSEVEKMMFSSGFNLFYEYKTKGNTVHIKVCFTIMTPAQKAKMRVAVAEVMGEVSEDDASAMD
jgi:hypothetical protein